ncbi:MAG: putative lipid II flippase FtsW [Gammaproteobacteria bacterium]
MSTLPQAVSSHIKPQLGYDPWLLGGFAFLLALGLVMVASASITIADREFQAPLYYFVRQLLAVGLGLTLTYGALCVPIRVWRHSSKYFLLAAIVLLLLVLIPGLGHEVNGSLRWLRIGTFSVQPSEPAKLCTVVYLAGYVERHRDAVRYTFRGMLRPMAVLTLIAGLLLLEPDYGVTVVLFATALGMLFLGGVSLTRFAGWGLLGIAALAGLVWAAPYRVQRLMAFMDPWADPYDKGFQLVQALIAFGRGEWLGVGLGGSVQKLFYLPEAHNDFIFAVLAEELGLVGSLTVITAFLIVAWRALLLGEKAERYGRPFAAFLAYGIGLLIGLQAYINIGVSMGVLPTKGLTLPLVSYGGNSVVVTCIAFGLLLRIDHESRCSRHALGDGS